MRKYPLNRIAACLSAGAAIHFLYIGSYGDFYIFGSLAVYNAFIVYCGAKIPKV